jgi:hypothetical protein|tara:strand:- start:414 stop:1277 length:864 start_codon:yes stop_codon:yes gene_type:complete
MIDEDFAVFILTHGRPDNVKTFNTLKRFGYTGKIYIIIDNEDKRADEYYKNFDNVVMFNKKDVALAFDEGDNFNDRRSIVYARNACFNIAKELDITYFVQFDDDYTDFSYRFNDELSYINTKYINKVDDVFKSILKYYKKIPAKAIAFSQNGDWIGGKHSQWAKELKLKRKCMNSFFCSTERPFKFKGRINEDVNTYTSEASKGDLFLTIPNISLKQTDTQSNSGGMSDVYANQGTYVKSFYSVMFSPSSVKVAMLNTERSRLHHRVTWNNAIPVILNEKYKKNGTK